jgi:hypothetical protein
MILTNFPLLTIPDNWMLFSFILSVLAVSASLHRMILENNLVSALKPVLLWLPFDGAVPLYVQ